MVDRDHALHPAEPDLERRRHVPPTCLPCLAVPLKRAPDLDGQIGTDCPYAVSMDGAICLDVIQVKELAITEDDRRLGRGEALPEVAEGDL